MKVFALIATLFAFQNVNADIIKCVFTEPFWDFEYSTTTGNLKLTKAGEGKDGADLVEVTENVSFQIKAAGKFELWDKSKKVIAILYLNGQGSNGMSDHVYPYDARLMDSGFGKLFGGCTSNFLKSYLPEGGAD